jgi:hypothetical protein
MLVLHKFGCRELLHQERILCKISFSYVLKISYLVENQDLMTEQPKTSNSNMLPLDNIYANKHYFNRLFMVLHTLNSL